ncbi:Cyclin-dependent kinase inhibitor 1B [Paramuricea clavata]|uniref:Cyclin-dependent kinase inhibitor 1B n=1 Tax=Paramuricea clavata TaxID=317549 RepID=A0A6S7JLB9_PARCT|nr:Cyclin-dependent kinase inhibitor 1B [Paramuricea clavata]
MSGRRGANVSRRLFDDAVTNEDCEQLNNINGDEANEQFLNRKQEEWNFDFRNGRPLPGRYVWQQVDSSSRRERSFTPVTPRASNNESLRSAVHTTTTREGTNRPADTRRHSPYNLRSRSRETHTNERGFFPIRGYTNRDRSSSRSSNTSNERLEGDVRT